ncbi:hypothetical protein GOP47_0019946 [Adiantum capillus-veneris]|uniref:Uncharacterized protein n=1 Tax=Adiantum capillus-veneris TaxID=13818 RepID=A0A9D4UDM6_ADICA|nr:hypothetical protein GOP47_0019946 [Adiantum capillus-veneris]
MLYDFYTAVLLVYDVAGQAHDSSSLQPQPAAAGVPVGRLQHAIQEMVAHFPCAAGLVVYNESIDRLEIKYPTYKTPNNGTHSNSPNNGSAYGLAFHVAHANVSLADLGDVSNPQPSLDLLYPPTPPQVTDSNGHPLPRFVMAFQVTTFKCGGFSIRHTCSHVYAVTQLQLSYKIWAPLQEGLV